MSFPPCVKITGEAIRVTRLEALAEQQPDQLEPDTPDMLRARADYIEATRGTIDLAAARAALDRMADLRTEAEIARLRARKEALDVLTPAQREKAERFGTGRRSGAHFRFERALAPGAIFEFGGFPHAFEFGGFPHAFEFGAPGVPAPPPFPAPPAGSRGSVWF